VIGAADYRRPLPQGLPSFQLALNPGSSGQDAQNFKGFLSFLARGAQGRSEPKVQARS
jgi:hypothetical protein